MEDIKLQHSDEVELLQSIIFEGITVVETEPWHKVLVQIQADTVDNPEILGQLEVNFTENYPNTELFGYKITDKNNKLYSYHLKDIHQRISEFYDSNQGFPIVFQVVEVIKEYLNELELKRSDQINALKELEIINSNTVESNVKSLVETRKFTPVTRESYEEWFKKFKQEKDKERAHEIKKKKELMTRTSGREFFMNIKNKNLSLDEEEGDDDGEDIDFSELKKEKKTNVDKKKAENKQKEEGKGNKMIEEESYSDEEDEDYDPEMFDDADIDIDEIDFEEE